MAQFGYDTKTDAKLRLKEIISKTKIVVPKVPESILRRKKDQKFIIRCHNISKSNKQCSSGAISGKIYCSSHRVKNGNRRLSVIEKGVGLIDGNKKNIIKEELEKINEKPDEEILDIRNDVKRSEAIISALLNQKEKKYKIGDKVGGRLLNTKEAVEEEQEKQRIKTIKSLQYSLMNNASIKKLFYEVKYNDANVVSKDLYKYTLAMYNQILIDEIKDHDVLQNIAKRIKQLSLDIIAAGMK